MTLLDRVLGREPRSRVRMIASVGEYVAGEAYDIPASTADQWIARGYAEGNYSRHYSEDEIPALLGNVQTVSL
jgi:hypothetical protein